MQQPCGPVTAWRGEGGTSEAPLGWFQNAGKALVATATAATLLCGPAEAIAAAPSLSEQAASSYFVDSAKIVGSERRTELGDDLKQLEENTGWKLRILTENRAVGGTNSSQIRKLWGPLDKHTAIVIIDPSAPNIVDFEYIGDDWLLTLSRGFWIELQSRYGNLFYVRDEGEQSTVVEVTKALTTCIAKDPPCKVVPGLPEEQYWFTLALSIAGGLVFGVASRLPPGGFVQRPWVWSILLSPLWGSLFVSFGLGPIVSRTDDIKPIIANTVAFLITAYLFKPAPYYPDEEDGADAGSSA